MTSRKMQKGNQGSGASNLSGISFRGRVRERGNGKNIVGEDSRRRIGKIRILKTTTQRGTRKTIAAHEMGRNENQGRSNSTTTSIRNVKLDNGSQRIGGQKNHLHRYKQEGSREKIMRRAMGVGDHAGGDQVARATSEPTFRAEHLF